MPPNSQVLTPSPPLISPTIAPHLHFIRFFILSSTVAGRERTSIEGQDESTRYSESHHYHHYEHTSMHTPPLRSLTTVSNTVGLYFLQFLYNCGGTLSTRARQSSACSDPLVTVAPRIHHREAFSPPTSIAVAPPPPLPPPLCPLLPCCCPPWLFPRPPPLPPPFPFPPARLFPLPPLPPPPPPPGFPFDTVGEGAAGSFVRGVDTSPKRAMRCAFLTACSAVSCSVSAFFSAAGSTYPNFSWRAALLAACCTLVRS